MDLLHPSPQHHGLPWHSSALFLYCPSPDSPSAHKYSIVRCADPFQSFGCIKTSATHDYDTLNFDTRPGYHTHWHLHCYIRLSKSKLRLLGEWITGSLFLNASIPGSTRASSPWVIFDQSLYVPRTLRYAMHTILMAKVESI